MALDTMKGKTQAEQFKIAAEFAGVPASVFESMWNVESGRGANMRSEAGARGHFQAMPDTQAEFERRTGQKFDVDDFTDGLKLAAHTMKENMQLAKGDLPDALRWYNAGAPSRWNNAETGAYVGKVLGDSAPNQSAYDVAGINRPSSQYTWETSALDIRNAMNEMRTGAGGKSYKSDIEKGMIDTAGIQAAVHAEITGVDPAAASLEARQVVGEHSTEITNAVINSYADMPKSLGGNVTGFEESLESEKEQVTETERIASITKWDKTKAAFATSTITGSLVDLIERQSKYAIPDDPDFDYLENVKEIESNRSREEILELRRSGAGSMGQAKRILKEQDRERERNQTLSDGSSGADVLMYSMGVGILGDPLGWVAGFGGMKAFQAAGVGSRALMVAGRPVAGLASAGVESGAGNLLAVAAMDAMGKHQSQADYATAAAMGFGMGIGFGALGLPGAHRERIINEAVELQTRMLEEAAVAKEKLFVEATAEAGPNATSTEIMAAATRIEARETEKLQRLILADIDDGDRIFPRADAERVDIGDTGKAPEAAPDAAPSPKAEAPSATADYVKVKKGKYNITESKGLRDAVTAAEVDGSVTTLLQGVAYHPNVPPHLRELAGRLTKLAEDMRVKVVADPDPNSLKSVMGGAYRRDTNSLYIRQATPETILHEVIHGVTSNVLTGKKANMTPTMRANVQQFDDLLSHVQAQAREVDLESLPAGLQARLKDQGGALSSTNELITYAMTDPTVQKWLASIPAPDKATKQPNAWEWLKEQIAKFLDLPKGDRTALDAVLDASGDLLDTIGGDTKGSYSVAAREQMAATAAGRQVENPAAAEAAPGALLDTEAKRDAAIKRYKLDLTIADPAERVIVAQLYAQAERILGRNPLDKSRLQPLLAKVGWEATSTTLLNSDNPVLRAFGVTVLENPEGAGGRQVTASMTKAMLERIYTGNALREYDSMYSVWSSKNGGSTIKDFYDSKLRRDYDKKVYAERDRRWNDRPKENVDVEISQAADMLDALYRRMGSDQKYVGTIGAQRLDPSRPGYQPRMWLPGVVNNLNDAQRGAVLNALSGEMQSMAGYDRAFADEFAVLYLGRVQKRAMGGYDVPAGLSNPQSADLVKGALEALDLSPEQIKDVMGKFSRGGAGHTKGRIEMDLTAFHDDGAGGQMQLMDLVNTDNIHSLRGYARRVSGEVALAKYGIMGDQGLDQMRLAAANGPDGMKATLKEMDAFDQTVAEFLGRPFGNQLGKWADNARSMTSALKLGGMGFNQFNEYANGIASVGVLRSMNAVSSMPRLLKEVRDLKAGLPSENSLLGSMELAGGEFGMDGYKLRGMYDVNDGFEVYGKETIGVVSKAIRAGAHGNRILSGHRAITAVQIRGMAEQIVMKSLRYARDGTSDAALKDMGFDDALLATLRAEMGAIAKFDSNGKVIEFDIMQMSDTRAANRYMQAVNRGASQIIQETYIGETGKWAHDGWLKMLTQFRTYGLVATQKQWRRQSYTHGTAKAFGYLLGGISVATPIHIARVQMNSLNRPDRDEYLERMLTPYMIGRSAMNYTAGAGLLPDIMDIGASITGAEITGGRAGNRSKLVGGQILPAAGVADDLWDLTQTRDPYKAAKALPGGGLPYLQGAVNMLDE